jgi:hypothetical protein
MQDWEIAARLGIQQTATAYGRCVDTGRLEELAGLFTERCHYDMGTGPVLTDRPAIVAHGQQVKAMFAADPNFQGRVRHHLTPTFIEFKAPDEAKAIGYFLTMGRSGPDHWGVYRDLLALVDEAWLFSRRVVTVEGFTPNSPAARTLLST